MALQLDRLARCHFVSLELIPEGFLVRVRLDEERAVSGVEPPGW
jgi:hypothetical protein